LVEAVRSLKIGPPDDPKHFIGPVIDAAAHAKIIGYLALGKREGKCVLEREAPTKGFFVGPAVFSEIKPEDRLANEEIFGPVLSVIKAKDFSHALQIANRSAYGLTGGVFSRSPPYRRSAPRFSRRHPTLTAASPAHRRTTTLRRLEALRHRFQSRRSGLFTPISRTENHFGEYLAPRVCGSRRIRELAGTRLWRKNLVRRGKRRARLGASRDDVNG
jgi:hypothetical protein